MTLVELMRLAEADDERERHETELHDRHCRPDVPGQRCERCQEHAHGAQEPWMYGLNEEGEAHGNAI